MKILMVCLGNICRSPLAEGILQHKAEKAGLNWIIDSAGTGHYETDSPPHILSKKVAAFNGIDISQQKCRQFLPTDMQLFDKIYVMDSDNYDEVKRISANHWNAGKVDYLMNEVYPGKNMEVPDPWFGGKEDSFHKVFELIAAACDKIILHYSGAAISTAAQP